MNKQLFKKGDLIRDKDDKIYEKESFFLVLNSYYDQPRDINKVVCYSVKEKIIEEFAEHWLKKLYD